MIDLTLTHIFMVLALTGSTDGGNSLDIITNDKWKTIADCQVVADSIKKKQDEILWHTISPSCHESNPNG